MKRILFATSEAVPFIKTGGLADVAGALPKCFDKRLFRCTRDFTEICLYEAGMEEIKWNISPTSIWIWDMKNLLCWNSSYGI